MMTGDLKETRTDSVIRAIKGRIGSRALVEGDRLPSIRSLASTLGVSPSTVVSAYDLMAAEGLIKARPGSGFYVSGQALPPLTLTQASTPQARAIDPFWVSRLSLDAEPDMPKPGCGWLPADWMPNDAMRRALRHAARSGDELLSFYGSTKGSVTLRRLLLARLAEEGLEAEPDNLMLTNTGTQALDLVCRFLLRPGDVVVVDDPCYFNFQAMLKVHQVRLVSVPYTPSGPDTAAFEALLAAERPKLYLTNTGLHNPTGATPSPQSLHRLLSSAARHDLTIVEDDIFADFEPEPSSRLATFDGLQRVIRIGSFSKTLSASVRCGYIAAKSNWIEGLVDLQVATNFGGPSPLAAELLSEILSGGSYRKHMEDLRRKLARARRDVTERLSRLDIEPWIQPRGGFYLWCRLPGNLDSGRVAQAALAEGLVLAPGNVFSSAQTATNFMRFNVGFMMDQTIYDRLSKAMAAA
ncbi:PLP-dependent aminotransferase family protein [Rhizobium sp. RU36D]|uniref:aminotransferase-like domain-containing protein n=1 Tax=Rhizobium sp. RU36D TaxID=1907415 RepID=UPI001FCE143B|nr:PLP-dependent aminotransferase family protein [Rhizobium sp. RU36D]